MCTKVLGCTVEETTNCLQWGLGNIPRESDIGPNPVEKITFSKALWSESLPGMFRKEQVWGDWRAHEKGVMKL